LAELVPKALRWVDSVSRRGEVGGREKEASSETRAKIVETRPTETGIGEEER